MWFAELLQWDSRLSGFPKFADHDILILEATSCEIAHFIQR
jgi:hypothetical protein